MIYDWNPLYVTFKLAFVTTIILLVIGVFLGYWIAFTRSKFKFVVQTLVSMPLVLPPTVLGFYILQTFSPESMIGKLLDNLLNLRLVFTFEGLILGSLIFGLPFMVSPIQSGLSSLPTTIIEAAYTLGKSKLRTLISVLLPNIKPSLLTGIVITFAHTIGEFGVVLMIGGNIPNETRVASIAIYDEVEALNYDLANFYSLILFSISFIILLLVNYLNKKYFSNKGLLTHD